MSADAKNGEVKSDKRFVIVNEMWHMKSIALHHMLSQGFCVVKAYAALPNFSVLLTLLLLVVSQFLFA